MVVVDSDCPQGEEAAAESSTVTPRDLNEEWRVTDHYEIGTWVRKVRDSDLASVDESKSARESVCERTRFTPLDGLPERGDACAVPSLIFRALHATPAIFFQCFANHGWFLGQVVEYFLEDGWYKIVYTPTAITKTFR